ncbi:MAG: ribosomal protein S18-alanine N-acetyltransferase [Bacteroidales bacterium]|jgi:ribosomal-protein-alanine acetyltransferase|nr:ribosomal protein S18-alanine N-acetyltransferase [Bacteroidales bacterium]
MKTFGKFKIEKARPSDLPDILMLEKASFSADAFTRHQFYYFIHQSKSNFVVVRNRQQILAYLIIQIRKNSRKYRIYSLAIAPNARGMGIATLLLGYAEQLAITHKIKKIKLEVSDKNTAAINLYQKQGYRKTGERSGYYADGSAAWIMEKNMPMGED